MEIRVRYNKGFGVLMLVLGAINLLLRLFAMSRGVPTKPYHFIVGVILLFIGGLYMRGTAFIITQREIQLKNLYGMTVRKTAIDGYASLEVSNNKLFYDQNGEKKRVRGVARWYLHKADWDEMEQAILLARSQKDFG